MLIGLASLICFNRNVFFLGAGMGVFTVSGIDPAHMPSPTKETWPITPVISHAVVGVYSGKTRPITEDAPLLAVQVRVTNPYALWSFVNNAAFV